MENKKLCIKCKQQLDISLFYKTNKNYLHSYCKECSIEQMKINIIEKYGNFKNYYVYLKSINPEIICECGKTITRPYWINDHVKTKYHIKHSLN